MNNRGKQIIEKAKEYVGTRYKHLGRDSIRGLDCIGLIIRVANDLGLTDYDTHGYPRRPILRDFHRELNDQLVVIPFSTLDNGDVLLMVSPTVPCHVGFYEVDEEGAEYLIHACLPAKKVIRERLGQKVRDRFIRAYRFPL